MSGSDKQLVAFSFSIARLLAAVAVFAIVFVIARPFGTNGILVGLLVSIPIAVLVLIARRNDTVGITWSLVSSAIGLFVGLILCEKRSLPPYCHKSFPVESDGHFLSLGRYVERNARQAHLVARAEDWRWSGLWRRPHGRDTQLLSEWPVLRPDDWLQRVNQPLTNSELAAIARSIRRGVPLGSPEWIARTANRLGLEHTLRSPGRPRLARR